ncbi:uncharacterized protein LOC129317057 isoform X4 [Prosopis cineraria]|uniref:uncharacterized protein LOC129317057 isoform X4 n=1 Tax=Prosopis cineraria TaxID=364024 RepID=UPI00240ED8F2|nr:uncharacterized protein LOC129317057 isoform X4 [Prosopis cineraria]
MGGGRKTKSYTLQEKSKRSWSVNCSISTRNLGKAKLAGVIFGCKNNTIKECISKLLFGLPATHISYVKHIRPGLPLFLFNYNYRKLHGIFEAASEGKMNIDPCGWTENGSECTPFPAQVRVRIQMQCQPLIEDLFGPIIIGNYYESNHFWFELDHSQTSGPGQFYEEFDGLKQHMETLYFSLAIDNDPCFPQKASMEVVSSKTNTLEENISLLDRAEIENCSLPGEESVPDANSQSTMHKILEEICQLKLNQVKQDQKIRSLEEELVESRRVIKNLKQLLEISECSSCEQTDLVTDSESSVEKSILIIGGFDGLSHLSCVDCYCLSRDSLESLCPMSCMRSYTSAVKLNDEIYVIGGECRNLWYDTVESYNLENNQWVTRPSMNQKKGSLAGIYLNEKIFAIGGSNGAHCFSEVEVFDVNVGMWILSQSMHDRRFSLAAANFNGAIYAAGGYDGNDYLKSLERYDPRQRSWERLESMYTKRSCHSLAVLDEKLYAIGGYDGERMVSTVEIYDPRMNRWTMGESMNNSRGYSAAVVIGNSIFAIGGLVEDNASDKVECYAESQGWHSTNLKGLGKRCSFSAVVL